MFKISIFILTFQCKTIKITFNMLFFKYSIKCHNFISLHIYYFFTCIKNYNLYDNFYSLNLS